MDSRPTPPLSFLRDEAFFEEAIDIKDDKWYFLIKYDPAEGYQMEYICQVLEVLPDYYVRIKLTDKRQPSSYSFALNTFRNGSRVGCESYTSEITIRLISGEEDVCWVPILPRP